MWNGFHPSFRAAVPRMVRLPDGCDTTIVEDQPLSAKEREQPAEAAQLRWVAHAAAPGCRPGRARGAPVDRVGAVAFLCGPTRSRAATCKLHHRDYRPQQITGLPIPEASKRKPKRDNAARAFRLDA